MTRVLPDAPAPAVASTAATKVLRYEGFPLETVLARVHAAHGADVTITSADRVRKGGIGGFFAREVFQVTVTVPADDDADAAVSRPISIFGTDHVAAGSPLFGPNRSGSNGATDDEYGFDYDDIDPEDVEGALGLDAPNGRDAADAEIWALLAQAATADHQEPAPVPAAAPVPAPIPEPAPQPLPEPVAAVEPAPEPVWAPAPAPLDEVPPVFRPPTSVTPELVAPIVAGGPIASTTLIPAGSRPVSTVFSVSPEAPTLPDPIRTSHPAPEPVDLDRLIDRFETAAPAPRLPESGVIAVLGTRAEALDIAGRLARALGIPTDDVIVAAPPHDVVVPTIDDALRLAATTRFRCNPLAVIVVELVPGRQGHEWARVVLDGLRPEQVRLAADTGRLLAHQHLGIAAVGGVDVIDLLSATAVPTPDDVLHLAAPVGTIDGRAATPELWAATVLAARAALASTGGASPGATVDRSTVGAR